MKTCTRCKEQKPESKFGKDPRVKNGLQSACKDCGARKSAHYYQRNKNARIQYAREWRARNPNYQSDYDRKYRQANQDIIKARERLRHTGWSLEQFEQAWINQDGKCAICCIQMKRGGKASNSVTADHCHATGITRKLLCSKCNLMLGHANDSIRRLKAAIDYLSEVSTAEDLR